jgi:transketolase
MRTAFVDELCKIAEDHPELILLTADLGYKALDPFTERFPAQFLNVGVAEQNMIGIAAGLALSGHQVVCYSIANFAVARCLEQLRNDVCFHNLPVVIATVGAGFSYGPAGYTHHGIEDAAWTRVLPGMAVATPADAIEARWLTRCLIERMRPGHLRLGRGGEPRLHKPDIRLPLFGEVLEVDSVIDEDLTFIATGAILGEAMEAARSLRSLHYDIGVVSAPVIQPLEEVAIRQIARRSRFIITVEEHVASGLGQNVATVIARMPGTKARVFCCGVNSSRIILDESMARDQDSHRAMYNLDGASLHDMALELLQ